MKPTSKPTTTTSSNPHVHELIEHMHNTKRNGRRLLAGTSYSSGGIREENVVRR